MAHVSVETARDIQTMANGLVEAAQLREAFDGKHDVTVAFSPISCSGDTEEVYVRVDTMLMEKLLNAADKAINYYTDQIESLLEDSDA